MESERRELIKQGQFCTNLRSGCLCSYSSLYTENIHPKDVTCFGGELCSYNSKDVKLTCEPSKKYNYWFCSKGKSCDCGANLTSHDEKQDEYCDLDHFPRWISPKKPTTIYLSPEILVTEIIERINKGEYKMVPKKARSLASARAFFEKIASIKI